MHTVLTVSNSPDRSLSLRSQSATADAPLQEGQVRLKTLACPINPIDNLVIIGRYPVKPKHTLVGEGIIGYDGVFQVVESCAPSTLAQGDYVIPRDHGFGTWRTHATAESSHLLKIPRLDPRAGAILKMGACPAYLLLEDMHELKPGDWVIQNAATGVIAQLVIQYARLRGVHTVSVVRDRPDCGVAKAWLQNLGGDIVITESELRSGECKALEGKRFVLGLDCVFGASGEAIANLLAPNSTYVNFGLLGGEKLCITSEMIFFKAITFRSFRLSKCLASRSDQEVDALLLKLGDLFATGQIQLPALDVVPWYSVDDVDGVKELEGKLLTAVQRARSNEIGTKKVIFSFLDHA
jgi:mitochondrial enoyl-[acyl-carrier protein] reductase / trans-2-enoyl-CoA reductase